MEPKEYKELSKKLSPPSPCMKNICFAFFIGGFICALGQVIINTYSYFGIEKDKASMLASATLVLIAVILTGFGLYEKIAKHAGAGTLVPITGFANSIASPAIEFKSEGLVLGLGAKMFVIAGPVLVYGISASVIYGIIYWLLMF